MKKIKSIMCVLALVMSAVTFMGCLFFDRTSEDNTTSLSDDSTTSSINDSTDSSNDVVRYTVTEEEWNNGINAGNFAGDFLAVIDLDNYEMDMCFFKYAGNAMEFDGNIIVFEGEKKYILEEVDGTWYATEWNEYDFCATLVPAGLNFTLIFAVSSKPA